MGKSPVILLSCHKYIYLCRTYLHAEDEDGLRRAALNYLLLFGSSRTMFVHSLVGQPMSTSGAGDETDRYIDS